MMNKAEKAHADGALVAKAEHDPFLGAPSFTLKHRIFRFCWAIVWALFASWTPPFMHRWRIALLNRFGAQVDRSCFIYGSVRVWYPPHLTMESHSTLGPRVDCYCMSPVRIGAYTVVSQGAFLCTGTHDFRSPEFQIYSRPISIGALCWICADAFVGPGVTVGEGVVLGARAAAFSDLEQWMVYSGNPAQPVKKREIIKRA
ncbi:LbetaH domain-containing protein [Novosphingobium beihaiensis]|uniref:Colanic acid biosynthesis acetyltransferase n=1 Tax=Novosphingobium beihaiensis TaxID=2930389 RepID=A0ABT0BQY7_9SPHN|nr:putative colanic acid biosynthesis acetyltransferase [Novosphingobium beihaiensis]MCJ2187472.1 putative colanic acid biosynthesis acetyltransferase [Novosphingobium beihaiensis]